MNKTQKTEAIGKVRENFDGSVAAVLINFEGIDVATVTQLRRDFRKAGVEYKVVKNTVIRHALKDGSFKMLAGDLENHTKASIHSSVRGMTAVAWCKEDPAAAAKVIESFKKGAGAKGDKLKVKAGLLGGQVRDGAWVEAEMAKLPGLKDVQASLLATLNAPAQETVAIINAPAQNLVYLLAAWVQKLEEPAAQ